MVSTPGYRKDQEEGLHPQKSALTPSRPLTRIFLDSDSRGIRRQTRGPDLTSQSLIKMNPSMRQGNPRPANHGENTEPKYTSPLSLRN